MRILLSTIAHPIIKYTTSPVGPGTPLTPCTPANLDGSYLEVMTLSAKKMAMTVYPVALPRNICSRVLFQIVPILDSGPSSFAVLELRYDGKLSTLRVRVYPSYAFFSFGIYNGMYPNHCEVAHSAV